MVIHCAISDDLGNLVGYVLIALDRTWFVDRYLPELARTHLGMPAESDLRSAVVLGADLSTPLYKSNPPPELANINDADLVVDLFARQPPPRGQIGLIRESRPWNLVLQHSEGSIDAVVRRVQRRYLAVGFGVILLIALNTGLLLYSARRANHLARLQMDFVAGVSHELRTPVTAIGMMADNLAEGTTIAPQQVRQYGRLLRQQGKRLGGMIEQILTFAANENHKPDYKLRPVSVPEVLNQAVASSRPLLESANMQLEDSVPENLPAALADASALQRCVENLIANAVKYASEGGWIGLSAQSADSSVRILVTDRGPGIPVAEERQIFQPFFRGASARASQIPGTGLGLSLVKQMMEAMGGRVSLRSAPGTGSEFVLDLPLAPAAPLTNDKAALMEEKP
jgi:signal transduction histidine kinase